MMLRLRGALQLQLRTHRVCATAREQTTFQLAFTAASNNEKIIIQRCLQFRLFSVDGVDNDGEEATSTGQQQRASPVLSRPKTRASIKPGVYSTAQKDTPFVPIRNLTEEELRCSEELMNKQNLPNFAHPRFKRIKPRASNPERFQRVVIGKSTSKEQTIRNAAQTRLQNNEPEQRLGNYDSDSFYNERDDNTHQPTHHTQSQQDTENQKQRFNRKQRRKHRQRKRQEKLKGKRKQDSTTMTQQQSLMERIEETAPATEYVLVNHIPPVSSLEAILQGVNDALDQEVMNSGGIVDLEACLSGDYEAATIGTVPVLDIASMFPHLEEFNNNPSSAADEIKEEEEEYHHFFPTDNLFRWVQEARIILSPFGRPCGWRLKFANRSIAGALLRNANKDNPLMCAWKIVTAKEWTPDDERKIMQHFQIEMPFFDRHEAVSSSNNNNNNNTTTTTQVAEAAPIGKYHLNYDVLDAQNLDWLNDSVLRVENCNEDVDEQDLLHIFSRYDLRSPSVVRWTGMTVDGKKAPATFMVRFSDASWARAALREKQATVVHGATIRLAQYPRQRFQDFKMRPKEQTRMVT